jgi:hypothetical protein
VLRKKRFRTAVRDYQECSSACALAWLGGMQRFLGYAMVGFHAPYTKGSIVHSDVGWNYQTPEAAMVLLKLMSVKIIAARGHDAHAEPDEHGDPGLLHHQRSGEPSSVLDDDRIDTIADDTLDLKPGRLDRVGAFDAGVVGVAAVDYCRSRVGPKAAEPTLGHLVRVRPSGVRPPEARAALRNRTRQRACYPPPRAHDKNANA